MSFDRVKTTTTTTGTGDITVGAAATRCRPLSVIPIGTKETFVIEDEAGTDWEISECTVTSANTFTRDTVLAGSNGASKVNFGAGAKSVICVNPAKQFNSFLKDTDTVDVMSLANTAPLDTHSIPMSAPDGTPLRTTLAAVKAYIGTVGTPADTANPNPPTNLASSNVTQAGFTITFTAGTDNVGVLRHDWSLDGTSWTQLAAGVLTFNVSGRIASTLYTVRVRTVDTSGNTSSAATLGVTTAAPSGDTTAPSMSGSITVSAITESGYTFSYSAGSDNVAVDHYETSIDGGTTWQGNALNLSRVVTGRPASTTDQLRVRAHDAAGLMSNVLSGTATTTAPAPAVTYDTFNVLAGVTSDGATPPVYSTVTTSNNYNDFHRARWDKKLAVGADGSFDLEIVSGSPCALFISNSATQSPPISNASVLFSIENRYGVGQPYNANASIGTPAGTVGAVNGTPLFAANDRVRIMRTNSGGGGNTATLTALVYKSGAWVTLVTVTNFPSGELYPWWSGMVGAQCSKLQSTGLVAI